MREYFSQNNVRITVYVCSSIGNQILLFVKHSVCIYTLTSSHFVGMSAAILKDRKNGRVYAQHSFLFCLLMCALCQY